MGKLQSDRIFIHNNEIPKKHKEASADTPPQIPPRMTKKGPVLPEKPLHMRAKSDVQSSHSPRKPLKPRILNLDKAFGSEREVLVAASKGVRERPVEKRQREPAKLLMPARGILSKKEQSFPAILDSCLPKKESSVLPSKGPIRLENCIPAKKETSIHPSRNWPLNDSLSAKKSDSKSSMVRKSRPVQPVLLIPRNLLTWGSTPISYALWTQRDVGRGAVKPIKQGPIRQPKTETSDTSAVRMRSGSVTRSGSLTSQGSSSSDSGGETFPKSVLKKQKRITTNNNTSKSTTNNRKVEHKKNVTFNAFTTVQLMDA